MPPIELVLLRHAQSESNRRRDPRSLGYVPSEKEIADSREVPDPHLTPFGKDVAEQYGPLLQDRLLELGFRPENTLVGSSRLLRAQQTVRTLFPEVGNLAKPLIFKALGEFGNFPENTPTGRNYEEPSWEQFLEELKVIARKRGRRRFVVVAHGGFIVGSLKQERVFPVWRVSRLLGGRELDNLEGVALRLELSSSTARRSTRRSARSSARRSAERARRRVGRAELLDFLSPAHHVMPGEVSA